MRAMANPSLYTRRKNGERWTYERIKEGRGHRNNDLSGPDQPEFLYQLQ
jgi:hypothetical protein